MKNKLLPVVWLLACTVIAAAHAQPAGYPATAAAQAAANAQPGARRSPAHISPAPSNEVSSQMQAMIAAPYPPHFNADPKDAAEWKELINRRAALAAAAVPMLKEKLGGKVAPPKIGGVNVFIVTPEKQASDNRARPLMHVHGDGSGFGPGGTGLPQAML